MKQMNLNKKTSSNCYSITIRTGNGLNLGSKPVDDLFAYLKKNFQFFIFSVEMEEENAHFQGGVFTTPSKRQDNLKRDIQRFVDSMYIDGLRGALPTDKGLSNMRKYALKVKPHNNFDILVRYTLKEGISYLTTPFQHSLPEELQYYVPEQYCLHDNVATHCNVCYKQEDPEPTLLSPDGYERLKYFDKEQYFLRKLN